MVHAGDAGFGKNMELARLFFSMLTGDDALVFDLVFDRLVGRLGASLSTSSTFRCNVVRLLLLVVSMHCG